MKKLLLSLLALGHVMAMQAMNERCNTFILNLTNCVKAVKNMPHIEPLDLKMHGDDIRRIFKDAFPTTEMPAEFQEEMSSPQGSVLTLGGAVKGFIIKTDESPNILKRLGFALFNMKEVRHINWFVMDASYRKKQYGTKLWNHIENDARQKGIETITLTPTSDAIPFYQNKGLYCVSSECYAMKKNLSNPTIHRPAPYDLQLDAINSILSA